MTDTALSAMLFAREIHAVKESHRTSVSHCNHLSEIAGVLAAIPHDSNMISLAWLRDSMQDKGVSKETLVDRFGPVIAFGVVALTDTFDGHQDAANHRNILRVARAPGWVQTVKCAELICNFQSIGTHPSRFGLAKLAHARNMLAVLKLADPLLVVVAANICAAVSKDLESQFGFTAPDGAIHPYTLAVQSQQDRDEFAFAFAEGQSDKADGSIFNEHSADSPSWHGYELGCAFGGAGQHVIRATGATLA